MGTSTHQSIKVSKYQSIRYQRTKVQSTAYVSIETGVDTPMITKQPIDENPLTEGGNDHGSVKA